MDMLESNRLLLLLSDFLEAVPPQKFYFGLFSGLNSAGEPDVCGTTGCAIGLASTMPEFKALGLTLKSSMWGNDAIPCVGNKEYSDAIAEVLGISVAEADLLFYPMEEQEAYYEDDEEPILYASHQDATPAQVAQHLREFVRDRA